MEVNIRNFEKNDINSLSNIICHTWGFDSSFSPHLAYLMGRLYLADSLCKSNFSKVAVVNGNIAGFIAVRAENLKKGTFGQKLFMLKCLFPTLFNIEAWQAFKIFSDIDKLNNKMYQSAEYDFDGEVTLFVMDESLRGLGIGKKLYKEAMEFFKKQNVKNYFVFTDTTCNYGFYEHEGAKRLKEEELFIPL